MARTLPRWMHEKHGAYYLVRRNKWHRLAGNLHDALIEYARLTSGAAQGALGDLVSKSLDDMKLTVASSTFKNYTTSQGEFSRRSLNSTPSKSGRIMLPASWMTTSQLRAWPTSCGHS